MPAWILIHRLRGDMKEILPWQFIAADLCRSLPIAPPSIDRCSLPDIIGHRRSVGFDLSVSGVFP